MLRSSETSDSSTGCRHIHLLSGLQLGLNQGRSLKVNEDRHKRKTELLRELTGNLKDFTKKAAYLSESGQYSNQKWEQTLKIDHTSH